MDLQLFNAKMSEIKKGAYTKISYRTNGKDGLYKIVNTIVRIGLEYESTSASDKPRAPKEKVGEYAFNGKNGAYTYLYLSGSKKHKARTIYYNCDGIEIDKQEYETINPPKAITNKQGIFSKKIADIISIG